MPDWYAENINVGIMEAPIGKIDHTSVEALKILSDFPTRRLIEDAVELTGYYNLLSPDSHFDSKVESFCSHVKEFCSLLTKSFTENLLDPKIDNINNQT